MNRNLWLLGLTQALFLANNITFSAINGLVGARIAPYAWMATLPVMGYVVGGALSTRAVALTQARWGRRVSFQVGLVVAMVSAATAAAAVFMQQFWLLVAATVVAGYYNANGQLYRFAAAELAAPSYREKAVSLVLAGGLLGGVIGPNLANWTRSAFSVAFAGTYLALVVLGALALAVVSRIEFPPTPPPVPGGGGGRPLGEIMRSPVFMVSAIAAAASYGVMNLLMAATPLAMDLCGMPFSDTALVLEWHVIGMFAPGFFTGHLLRRFGTLRIMGVGVLLNLLSIAIALLGESLWHYLAAMLVLGVGWNFLFTGSTTLSMNAYRPEEKDRAQGAINFCVFATMAVSSFSSGALITTTGWFWLNISSIAPVLAAGAALVWLARRDGRCAQV